jgi:hypothetical protein
MTKMISANPLSTEACGFLETKKTGTQGGHPSKDTTKGLAVCATIEFE